MVVAHAQMCKAPESGGSHSMLHHAGGLCKGTRRLGVLVPGGYLEQGNH